MICCAMMLDEAQCGTAPTWQGGYLSAVQELEMLVAAFVCVDSWARGHASGEFALQELPWLAACDQQQLHQHLVPAVATSELTSLLL